MRSTPARQPGRACCASTSRARRTRVRVFELGRVFLRDAGVADGRCGVAGVHQPMRAGGAGLRRRPTPLQWGVGERAVDFFDIKGDVEALLAPRGRALRRRRRIRRCIPGAARAIELDGARDRLRRRAASALAPGLRAAAAPMLFELDAEALMRARRCRASRRCRSQQSAWRDLAVVAGDDVTHDALMARRSRAGETALVRRRDAVRHLQARRGRCGRHRRRRAQPGRAPRAAATTRRTLTDERSSAVVAAVARSAAASASARACAQQ